MQDSPALENVCTWKCTSNRPERRGDTGWQLWMRKHQARVSWPLLPLACYRFWCPSTPTQFMHIWSFLDTMQRPFNSFSPISVPLFAISPASRKILGRPARFLQAPPNLQGYCKDKMGNNPHEICLHLLGSHAYNATWTMPQKGQIPTANQKCEPSFYK